MTATVRRPRPLSWQRVRYILVVGGSALLGMAAAVLAMNLWDHDAPPLLYDEGDLASVPPREANGWLLVMEADERRRAGASRSVLHDDVAVRDAVDAVLDGTSSPEAARAALAVTLSDEQRRFRADCGAAMARPRFVDACRLDLDDGCRVLAVLHCSREMLHDAVHAEAVGDRAGAVRVARNLLGATRDHGDTARSIVSHAVAQDTGAMALRLAALLARRDRRAARELRPLIAAFPKERHVRSHASKAEYVRMTQIIDDIAERRGEYGAAFLVLDRGETMVALNDKYEAHGHVERRDADIAWWLDNAMGDFLVDAESSHRWLARYDGRRIREARAAALIAAR